MKSAQELRESKKAKLEQRLKENTERINMELVEIEKAQNKWESELDNNKPYFEIPILIKTKEVKDLLAEQEYIIDKISNDIELNTSRIWVDKEAYRELVKSNYKQPLDYSKYGTIKNFVTSANKTKQKAYEELTNSCFDKDELNEKKTTTEECMDLFDLLQRIGQLHTRERSCGQ
jgi:hypothetical protein